jgi:heterodisulfide reductase subunit C
MDWMSSQVMRLIHLGAEDMVLGSEAIWLCASCQACSTRCPMDIDIAHVMDALRILAVERRAQLATSRDTKFGRSFLGSVRRHGRAFELELLMVYKLRTLDLFSDIDKAPKMLARRKLKLLPNRSPSVREVRRVFRRAAREEK